MKSMTGFGKAEAMLANRLVRCEAKSLNARNLEVNAKSPSGLLELEAQVHKLAKQMFHRGKIFIHLALDRLPPTSGQAGLFDEETALAAYRQLQKFAEKAQAPKPDLSLLFQWDLSPAASFSSEEMATLLNTVKNALIEMENSRKREGEALSADFMKYCQQLEQNRQTIEQLAPQQTATTLALFRENVAKLLENNQIVDENRMAAECAIFAEKLDISEEISRLKHHIATFDEALTAEPAGKKMGFLIQELHREVNTIASKSNYLPILQTALGMKEIIEKIREQVANVE